jgi:ubiquitin-activating enzyme E1
MGDSKIDESLYSRQLYVMGHEAQRRMQDSRVLIVGLDGLGVETAKNVILAGVKSVDLHDNTPASYTDLSSQFYLSEADLGKPRAGACASKLSELNPYVPVNVLSGELTTDVVSGYRVVLMVDVPSSKHLEIAEFCHKNGICVIVSESWGVFGRIFCDFGDNFICYDVNGENAATSLVAGVSKDENALVTCLEDTRHQLEDGDYVVIADVEGMPEFDGKEFKVTVKDPFSFEIPFDTTNLGTYVRGGTIAQVKKPTPMAFDSMTASMTQPGMFVTDWGKLDRVGVLHLAFQACQMFREQNGSLPRPGNAEDAQRLYDLTMELNNALSEDQCKVSGDDITAQEMLIKRLAMCSQGRVGACTAMLGGIVGQEVLKACSGKFSPIKQWFYFDAVETLSSDPLPEEEVSAVQSRYDGQIMVYGKATQARLEALKLFVVGAGAIGCEMLKNFAMMGIGCGEGGAVHVTDMDHIEKSNLSRQFLFRNSDINHPKSAVACRAAKAMNPGLNAVPYENKVGPDTEVVFNDMFFDSLDGVFTALDNVDARLYVDQRCIFYRKPMLESGTLGTKGSTQVVMPSVTEHYGAKRDPPEKSFAICTLAHFPRLVEHTLAWARDFYEEAFKQTADDVNAYLDNPNFFSSLQNQQNMKLDTLNRIRDSVITARPSSYADCVAYARRKFQDLFVNKIKQLLHNFPLDKQIKSNGGSGPSVPFWSGAKKPPRALEFDIEEPLHFDFIKTCANLRASAFDIEAADDLASIKAGLVGVTVEEFMPVDGLVIPSTDEEAKTNEASANTAANASMDVDQQCAGVMQALPKPDALRSTGFTYKALEFDKDDDAQMQFITACSNCRARNYGIAEANLHQSRGIAGKITPAIATTTALVTGAICLELFKVLRGAEIDQLFNSFYNLALPLFTHEEPLAPEYTRSEIKGEEFKFSIWDRIEIDDPSMTLGGLIDYLENDKGLELSMLSAGVSILYSDFMDRKKVAQRKDMTLKAVAELVAKKEMPDNCKFMIFEIICNDVESGDEVEVPCLRVRI